MRRVLFDENLPRKLRRELSEFFIRTVQEQGWGNFKNGELLRRAQVDYDVLVTADRRMQYQQNLAGYDIGIVVIVTPRLSLRVIGTAIEPLRAAIGSVTSGEIIRISVAAP